jgi:hypothetical protein
MIDAAAKKGPAVSGTGPQGAPRKCGQEGSNYKEARGRTPYQTDS